MAVLDITTLTGCTSIPDFIPTGSAMTFIQASAPVNWTRVTTDVANDRMFRVISSGFGAGTGGSESPILNNVVPSHTHGFTTGNQTNNHTHDATTGNNSVGHDHANPNYAKTGQLGYPLGGAGGGLFVGAAVIHGAGTGSLSTGGISANHTHPFSTNNASVDHTHSGTTDNGSSQTNWAPRYVDCLLCTKN